MEYWEFLLQQEGDSNWLPLDTSQMEILEGRYRIMAHCSQPNTAVQVHISQLMTDQDPPKRRSLRRVGHTNENGLLVVLPLKRLTSGTWDIYCQGTTDGVVLESPSESTSAASLSWQYAIQLRVLPQGVGEDGDWFADDGSSPSLEAEVTATTAQPLPASNAEVPTTTSPEEQRSDPSASTPWSEDDLQQWLKVLDQSQENLADAGEDANTLYPLTLDQTAFMAGQGQSIHLTGQANSVIEGESCSDMTLVVRLSDPQTAEVITLVPCKLASSTFPASFAVDLAFPEALSTRLLLGEVALMSRQAGAFNLLSLKRFTVTIDLAALFDEIANRAEDDPETDLLFAPDQLAGKHEADPTPDPAEGEPAGWDGFEFPSAPPRSVPTITLPRSHPTIPPKIYYPSPHEVNARNPVLPPFGPAKPAPTGQNSSQTGDRPTTADATPTADKANTDATAKTGEKPTTSTNPRVARSPQGLSLPPLKTANPQPPTPGTAGRSSPGADLGQGAIPQSSSTPSESEPLMLPSHETMAFKALNLQERFWSRLNDLAATIQQEANQAKHGAVEAPLPDVPAKGDDDYPTFIPFEGEVVIYDDPDTPATEITPEAAASFVDRLDQGDDVEPLTPPVPEIDIASPELTAKETILLTLRVPFHPNRLYLKVWITDPQTRSLTDEPRQITHLVPNGHGQLEGSIQLTVPMGCLEVWLEAISVDMVTQQESYKASISCSVNPLGAESPSADVDSLDEFDL